MTGIKIDSYMGINIRTTVEVISDSGVRFNIQFDTGINIQQLKCLSNENKKEPETSFNTGVYIDLLSRETDKRTVRRVYQSTSAP